MSGGSPEDSIFDEPHLHGQGFESDPSEAKTDRIDLRRMSEAERVEQSVWDEPGISPSLAGETPHDETYGAWLARSSANTSFARSWTITLLIAAAAGPWAVFGTFLRAYETSFPIIGLVLLGPLVEEMMKAALPLYIVEKRPYLFRSPIQIAICMAASGLAFAAIENLLYLYVYVPNPPPGLVIWRWTVCVGLHSGCSTIAGIGMARMWLRTRNTLTKPSLPLAAPWLTTAVVVHGLYNAFAIALEMIQYRF